MSNTCRDLALAAALAASMLLAATGCARRDEPRALTAADRQLIRDNILSKPPKMDLVVNADLEGKLMYLGCDVDRPEVSPGETFTVVHYWEVIDPPGPDWRLFTHLGPMVVNVDRIPVKGKYPIPDWNAGEIIRDEQQIVLPYRWNAPFVIVYVGVYHASARLQVRSGDHDGTNRVIAVRVPVRGTSREAAVPEMDVRQAWRAPVIDGKLDDPAWAEVENVRPMVNADSGGSVFPGTDFKMLWDKNFVYFGLRATDVARTSADSLKVLLAHDDGKRAVDVDVSWSGQASIASPIAEPALRSRRERKAGRPAPVLLVSAAIADAGVQRQEPAGIARPAGAGGAAAAAKVASMPLKAAAGTPATPVPTGPMPQWTAEIAIPWSAFPDRPFAPNASFRFRGNIVRQDQDSRGFPILSAWSPSMGVPMGDLSRLGVFNLANDVGALVVSRTPLRVPGARDLPGEMRGLTPDR